jgi:hypothetical protein
MMSAYLPPKLLFLAFLGCFSLPYFINKKLIFKRVALLALAVAGRE